MNEHNKACDARSQATMTKTIANRLSEARELCSFSAEQAAFLLGIDRCELEKIESKKVVVGRVPAPHWLILKASKVYDVSIDWLFGCSTDWEFSADARRERNTLSFIETHVFLQNKHDQKVIGRMDGRLKALESTVGVLPQAICEISAVLDRFRELNPNFDDMKMGASLINRVNEAKSKAHQATCNLVRFKCIQPERLADFIPE
jgi:transcriptional regulator with XRE-family HTH domain